MLREHYTISDDWKGEKYAGIDLDWDYDRQQVHLSMPGYCRDALVRFGHIAKRQRDQPHKHTLPVYGSTVQYAKEEDKSPKLDEEKKKFVQ